MTQLQTQIQEFEVALASSKEQIASLEQSVVGTSASLEAATIQENALLKAQSDYKAITEEAETLKAVHTKALQDSESQIAELRVKAAEAESLEAQVAALKEEKEENSNKLSELEIEILELKEAQDGLEDTRDRLQQKIAALEDELANAAVASGIAKEAESRKEAEHAQKLKALVSMHEKELETEAARYAEVVASLEVLNVKLSETLAAYEQSKQDLLGKEEKHSAKIAALEDASATSQAALSAEIEKITKELQVSAMDRYKFIISVTSFIVIESRIYLQRQGGCYEISTYKAVARSI